jgi:hypothetical protein
MLFLFETAAGYALFKVVKEGKLEKTEVRGAPGPPARRQGVAKGPGASLHAPRNAGRPRGAAPPVGAASQRAGPPPQDLYKDFETLDSAQKVGDAFGRALGAGRGPAAAADRRRLPPPPPPPAARRSAPRRTGAPTHMPRAPRPTRHRRSSSSRRSASSRTRLRRSRRRRHWWTRSSTRVRAGRRLGGRRRHAGARGGRPRRGGGEQLCPAAAAAAAARSVQAQARAPAAAASSSSRRPAARPRGAARPVHPPPIPPHPCPTRPPSQNPGLKKFLKKNAVGETLAVLDAKLGSIIKEKLDIPCVYSSAIQELSRGVRAQMSGLIRCGLRAGCVALPIRLWRSPRPRLPALPLPNPNPMPLPPPPAQLPPAAASRART